MGFFSRWADRAKARQALREVRRLDDRDLADLGLGRDRLSYIAAARPGMRDQMTRMARRFGVGAEALTHPRWRALEVIEACAACKHADACAAWLDGCSDGVFNEVRCPNAERFTEAAA